MRLDTGVVASKELFMTFKKNNTVKLVIILLFLVSSILRFMSLPFSNRDMVLHNLRWYRVLSQNGIGKALATNFANYTPPYTYLVALATLTHDFIPPLTAIKLIPICSDLLGAFCIHKIVRLKYPQGNLSYLAAAIYFTTPTIIFNSAYWGQADSLYTVTLLICIYFLMTKKPFVSMLAFGAAFSLKAQAVFLLPFLGIMVFRKKIPWLNFGLIPLVYLLAISPVVILGRPFFDALLIYLKQSDSYSVLSMNAPNVYILFPNEWYSFIMPLGVAATIIFVLRWMYVTARSGTVLDNKYLIFIAFISVALTPFILPKMHDRYFYPADVFSIVLAFYWPSLWFIPILYQLISINATSVFLFEAGTLFVVFGFLLNTIVLAIILREQRAVENRAATQQAISTALSWLVAILAPIILFGVGLCVMLTPFFLRAAYAMPNISTEQYTLSKSERFNLASQTLSYLSNEKKAKFLENLNFDNNEPAFNDLEVTMLDNLKTMTKNALAASRLSLAFYFMLGWFAWAGDWFPKFRHGIFRGGWLTIGLAVILGIAALFIQINPNDYFQGAGTVLQLFPVNFWRDSILFVSLSLGGGGFLLTRIKARMQA
jgi:Gpi18-like mannosyltransferase